MATQDIIDYVMKTPENTNPTILKNLIEDVGIYEMDVPLGNIMPWSSDPNKVVGGRYAIYPELFQHSGLYRLHFDPPIRLYQIFLKNTPEDGSPVDEDPMATSNLSRMGFLGGPIVLIIGGFLLIFKRTNMNLEQAVSILCTIKFGNFISFMA